MLVQVSTYASDPQCLITLTVLFSCGVFLKINLFGHHHVSNVRWLACHPSICYPYCLSFRVRGAAAPNPSLYWAKGGLHQGQVSRSERILYRPRLKVQTPHRTGLRKPRHLLLWCSAAHMSVLPTTTSCQHYHDDFYGYSQAQLLTWPHNLKPKMPPLSSPVRIYCIKMQELLIQVFPGTENKLWTETNAVLYSYCE